MPEVPVPADDEQHLTVIDRVFDALKAHCLSSEQVGLLLSDLYDHFEEGMHLRDSIADHVSFMIDGLSNNARALPNRDAALSLRSAALGGQILLGALKLPLNMGSQEREPIEMGDAIRREII